jgi:hypothetical protein
MNAHEPNPNQMQPSDLPAAERLATAATGLLSAVKTQTGGEKGEHETPILAPSDIVKAYTEDWPAMAKKSAEQTIAKYGLPNEALPSRLIWYNNAPWKRTICYRDEVPHNFPQPHSDVIENFIDYHVPPEKASELARFDGSVIVERTKGEVSARCDMEAANILALNMMHEIVQGRLTAEQARAKYSEQTAAYVLSRPAPYAEVLQFTLRAGDTTDTDHVTIGPDLLDQSLEKVKDVFK